MCYLTKEIKNLRFVELLSNKEIEILETIYNFFSKEKTNSILCEQEIFNEVNSIATKEENIDSILRKLNIKIVLIEDIYFYLENELRLNSKLIKYNSNINICFKNFERPKYNYLPRIHSKQNKALQDIWNIHFAHKKESTN